MTTINNRHQDGNTPEANSAIPSSKKPISVTKSVDTQSVPVAIGTDGLNKMSGDSGISACPEEDNLFNWKGTISGGKDTVFEGTDYKLSLLFPNDYPFKPPKVKFYTSCFHPNVDVYGNNICLDILQDKWSSARCENHAAFNPKSTWRTKHKLTSERTSSIPLGQP